MEQREKLRIINPEPILAQLLRERKPKVMSHKAWDWTVDWVQDVGIVMRDRAFIAYTAASMASYGVLVLVSELFPVSRKLGILSKAMGIAER